MRYTKKHVIGALLRDPTQPLASLIHRSEALRSLNDRLKSLVPASIAAHCTVAHYEEGILILELSSSAFLTQLRYIKMELLQQLRQDPTWCHLRDLKLKVMSPLRLEMQTEKTTYLPPKPSLNKKQLDELKSWIEHLRAFTPEENVNLQAK